MKAIAVAAPCIALLAGCTATEIVFPQTRPWRAIVRG